MALVEPVQHAVAGKSEIILGAGLFTLPLWVDIIHAVSAVAGFIVIVGGAFITLHGVWRIVRLWPVIARWRDRS